MIHIVSPVLFSYDLSHVLLNLNELGGFSTLGAPVKPGEGFRSAAARIVGEANGPGTDPEDWECFHTLRVPQLSDRKILYHVSSLKSEGLVGMELKAGDSIWISTRTALTYTTEKLFGQEGSFHDALLPHLIPMAFLTLTTDFRNLEC